MLKAAIVILAHLNKAKHQKWVNLISQKKEIAKNAVFDI
jgi:hypothetical protein